jgi:RHS repeat-associated protein
VEQKSADLAAQTLEYSYATNGFVKTMKYPSGRVVTYTQSNAGRTLSASGSGAGESYASGLTYGANGAMLSGTWNGTGATRLVESRSYNSLGQLLTAEVKKGASDLKWKITNDFGNENNNGNLLKQSTDTGTATYGVRFVYDAVNRIRGAAEDAPNESVLASQTCSVVGGTWCVKYRADGYGNLWTENKSTTAAGVAAMSQAAYDAATNRLAAAGYYANGNQKHWVLNDPKSRAEYDSDGKMVKVGRVTTNDGTAWDTAQVLTTFTYNGAGQRVKKTVTQGPATQTIHYVYGLDGEVAAEWDSTPATASGRQYLVGDHLGSTRVRFDSNGDVLQRIDYEPFGTEVQRTGVSGYSGGNEVTRKFTGKERDAETGLDYFGARYMASAQGRFTSPDPLLNSGRPWMPQSWNRYAYTLNNPLRFTDPTGLYEWGSCSGTAKECDSYKKTFRDSLSYLKTARDSFDKKSREYKRLDSALKAYGKEGEKNGVSVGFGALDGGAAGRTTPNSDKSQFGVVFDPAKMDSTDTAKMLAVNVGHEGTHVDDFKQMAGGASLLSGFAQEYRGYETSAFVFQGLFTPALSANQGSIMGGTSSRTLSYAGFTIWSTGWAASDKATLQTRDAAITNVVKARYPHEETTPHNPWGN